MVPVPSVTGIPGITHMMGNLMTPEGAAGHPPTSVYMPHIYPGMAAPLSTHPPQATQLAQSQYGVPPGNLTPMEQDILSQYRTMINQSTSSMGMPAGVGQIPVGMTATQMMMHPMSGMPLYYGNATVPAPISHGMSQPMGVAPYAFTPDLPDIPMSFGRGVSPHK